MTTKHTPGPWSWDCDVIKNDPLERVRYRVVARGKTVTQCYYSSSDENAQHDARLIAAAPDLLEALKRSRAQWIHSVNAEQCLAAIAKAEGQQ